MLDEVIEERHLLIRVGLIRVGDAEAFSLAAQPSGHAMGPSDDLSVHPLSSAARSASFGLVTSTVPVSSLDWAACRDAEAGRVLAAGGRLVLVTLHAIGYLRVL